MIRRRRAAPLPTPRETSLGCQLQIAASSSDSQDSFACIEDAIAAIRAPKMVVVADDEDPGVSICAAARMLSQPQTLG
jgi:hypothetical protein